MLGLGLGINKSSAIGTTNLVLYQTSFSNGGALPAGITVSDSVDVIIDNNADYVSNSSGYVGASGGYKIVFTDFFNGDAYASFTISGIATIGKENLRLSFGCVDIVSSEVGAVEYSLNGVDWVAVGGVAFGGDPWSLRTVTLPEACENVANLRLRWIWQQGGFGDYKGFDDVKLLGDLIP